MATFSQRLRELRIQNGLTQSELANKIKVHKQTISQYERGVRRPDLETLSYLSDIFNVSTDYLTGESNVTMRFVDSSELERIDSPQSVWIPVYGEVAAGVPLEMIEDIRDKEQITSDMLKGGKRYFALTIRGNSMEPRMMDGDVVIVLRQDDAESGDVVIATVNGDSATCKRLRKYRDGIELISFNPTYEPKFFTNAEVMSIPVKILGKVVELRGKF